jgi:hypothetical protein
MTAQAPPQAPGAPPVRLPSGQGTAAPWSLATFTPIPVPAEEPTAPEERAALEEAVRTQLRLLQAPYERLEQAGTDLRDVQRTVRACREAVNRGALREAALSLNAAAELIGRLLDPTAPPGGWAAPAP